MQKAVSSDLLKFSIRQPSTADKALTVLGTSIICVSFFFMIFPMVDLAVSQWFARDQVFVLAEQPFLQAVRRIGRDGQIYLIGAMLLLMGLQAFGPKRYEFGPPHKPLFVLLSFAVGPFIVVHVLKFLIGRVRPRDLYEFGGSADFTPVWQFSAACSRSCSFPSGESSAAAAALSLLVFIPARLRGITALAMVPFLLMIAFNRVLFGAHFLSDIMLGWLFTMFAMVLIWRWMEPRSDAICRFITRARP
ncbi:phosphatase PAP2 family protein [Shinella sp.]|uniref:phosphatase PAP2 family protein n=1 Tax=Shinella sp. TaxID=1870904 RepID=UPI0028A9650F|nr:phosphatase PAP2 family protein [Shinella sp.]